MNTNGDWFNLDDAIFEKDVILIFGNVKAGLYYGKQMQGVKTIINFNGKVDTQSWKASFPGVQNMLFDSQNNEEERLLKHNFGCQTF